jgi:hypothetical protein
VRTYRKAALPSIGRMGGCAYDFCRIPRPPIVSPSKVVASAKKVVLTSSCLLDCDASREVAFCAPSRRTAVHSRSGSLPTIMTPPGQYP